MEFSSFSIKDHMNFLKDRINIVLYHTVFIRSNIRILITEQ